MVAEAAAAVAAGGKEAAAVTEGGTGAEAAATGMEGVAAVAGWGQWSGFECIFTRHAVSRCACVMSGGCVHLRAGRLRVLTALARPLPQVCVPQ